MGFTISIELLASATSFHLEVLAGKIVGATKRKNKEVCTTNSGLPNYQPTFFLRLCSDLKNVFEAAEV